ncbi:MAG: hypothetical protein ACYDCK_05520 [Thermoplasmatota archaeon]
MNLLVAGAGRSGTRAAALLGGEARVVEKTRGEMLLEIVLDAAGRVAGGLLVRPSRIEFVPASAIVLATGGMDALFSADAAPALTGDGLVIAHRVGARVVASDGDDLARARRTVAVAVDERGATTVDGLFAIGHATLAPSGDARAIDAARAHARAHDPAPPRARDTHPTIDAPLPPGFVAVKLERLRAVLAEWRAERLDDTTTRAALLRLKGEADEYSRARVDADLFSFQNACEAALMLVRHMP